MIVKVYEFPLAENTVCASWAAEILAHGKIPELHVG
jgi:hypothetical protein